VQQAILLWWPGAKLPILTCVAITAVLAFLSWHLVEAPALALKGQIGAARSRRAPQPSTG
jgi:peptidoglycan/LPS O-acetylase OafA/YrhL